MGSSRFPGKALELLNNKPVLEWVLDAAKLIPTIDQVIIATTDSKTDLPIVDWCMQQQISVFTGSEPDVLSMYYDAAKEYKADVIVRVTDDCPLLDANIVGQVLYLVSSGEADYASNILPATWPNGLDCEAFTFKALEDAFKNAKRLSDREQVTPYIRNSQYQFKVKNVSSSISNLHKHRWTVETKEDLEFIEKLVKNTKKNSSTFDYLQTLRKNPDIVQPNYKRNEGFDKSVKNETAECVNFENSNKLLERALETIPLGSQTFSKSYIQHPLNHAPLFLTHGMGAKVWDVDGNEYVDLVNGLLPVILGYNDIDVNNAIQTQLQKGVSFSLATELESELAELLCSIIPSAEKVRFAKNGTDVTSAAVRIARAYTGRDKIIVCGYHGWQDWYIGTTTRNKGVPKAVSDLSISVPYNDLDRIESLLKTEEYAGVIMEPCNISAPHPGYLENIKKLCEKFNSLLIFDEIVTGFRMAMGGAQEYFGITPHLSCFGKAMGNGMPISAIVGQNHIMKEMDEIFFSGTFGGESLSLAAAIATIKKMKSQRVIDYIWEKGKNLSEDVRGLIRDFDLDTFIDLKGFAPWSVLTFSDSSHISQYLVKTFFQKEMIKNGVLILGSNNISFSHTDAEIDKIKKAYKSTLKKIKQLTISENPQQFAKCEVITPLFKVR